MTQHFGVAKVGKLVKTGMWVVVMVIGVFLAGCGRSAPDEAATDSIAVLDQTTLRPTTTATTAPPPPTQVTYVIQSGDSLSVIAERFGISTAALAEFNAIGDVNAIKVGQEIRIPPASVVTTTTDSISAESTTASS